MSLFCLQMTTLFVYDYDTEYRQLRINTGIGIINERQLLRIATSTPNIRDLRLNRPVVGMSTENANRLTQLWPRVQKLDLDGSVFTEQVLGSLMAHFPLLTKLKMDAPVYVKTQLFDSIFSNHSNLVDFECNFQYGADQNWFRSCHVPLERLAVNHLWDEDATLDTLESCCKDSLQAIKVGFGYERSPQLIRRIFSTFHQLREVSLTFLEYTALQNQPVLPHLEKLCLCRIYRQHTETLINFLGFYSQLKELRLEQWTVDDESIGKLVTALPDLRSLTVYSTQMTNAGWIKLTCLKRLEHFNLGRTNSLLEEDLQAFVRETPSLKRLTVRMERHNSGKDYSLLFKALRDDIRSTGSNRQLLVSQDDVMYFALDSSEECTDLAIEKFVRKTKINYKQHFGNC